VPGRWRVEISVIVEILSAHLNQNVELINLTEMEGGVAAGWP
jgi:hypothetical protein